MGGGVAAAAIDADLLHVVCAQCGKVSAQLFAGFEAPVVGERVRRRCAEGAGDMAGRRFSGFLRSADIGGLAARVEQYALVRKGCGLIGLYRAKVAGAQSDCSPARRGRRVLRDRVSRLQPGLKAAVEDAHVVTASPAQRPPCARGLRAAFVVVDHHKTVRIDPKALRLRLQVRSFGQGAFAGVL